MAGVVRRIGSESCHNDTKMEKEMKKHVFFTAIFSMVVIFGVFGGGKKEFTVSFVAVDAVPELTTQPVPKGKTATRPADPVKPGFILEGWYKDNTAWNFDSKVKKDETLKAKWRDDPDVGVDVTPKPDSKSMRLVTKEDLAQLSYKQKEGIRFYSNVGFELERWMELDVRKSVENGKINIDKDSRGEQRFIELEMLGRIGAILPDGALGIYFGKETEEIDRAELLYFYPDPETNFFELLDLNRKVLPEERASPNSRPVIGSSNNKQSPEFKTRDSGGFVYTVKVNKTNKAGGRPRLLAVINEEDHTIMKISPAPKTK
ncbi:hypothetical protein AGMMS49940_23100 [Spirochaetia bacterium]|nr:hypothetical protein AGMMS49940_23100 [Spirochaetia bacterium]